MRVSLHNSIGHRCATPHSSQAYLAACIVCAPILTLMQEQIVCQRSSGPQRIKHCRLPFSEAQ